MDTTISGNIFRVALSRAELAFAILDESHRVACRALLNIILEALKSSNPNDWKKKICRRFTVSARHHIGKSLSDGQPLTDIYVVCKILRWHINDIAEFCGGPSDPGEKERLSLQTQGIITARNWAFHGELVSAGEVFSSLVLLMLILKTLKVDKGFVQDIAMLQDQAKILIPAETHSDYLAEYMVSLHALGRVILYQSLTSFETLFAKLFLTDLLVSSCSHDGQKPEMSFLVKLIKKEIEKPKKESIFLQEERSRGKRPDKQSILASVESILKARNKLAHNEQMAFADIFIALINVADVLSSFGLYSEETHSAIQRLAPIKDQYNRNSDICISCTLQFSSEKGYLRNRLDTERRQRILRPKCLHFIGREQELQSISMHLCEKLDKQKTAVVLIYGPAGIGKSYLATKSAYGLRDTYIRQAWVCCSDKRQFQQDLTVTPYTFHQASSSKSFSKPMLSSGCSVIEEGQKRDLEQSSGLRVPDKWLVVYDDVCSDTVGLVLEKTLRRDHAQSVIITTRSTTVRACLIRTMKSLSLKMVNPQLFTAAESWELITKKYSGLTMRDRSSVLQPVHDVLGNLPLCVSIYASCLCASMAKSSEQIGCDLGGNALLLGWKGVEQQFGDCFHLRGLTGVVESAELYLEDHPFAVFLLAKICSTNSERVPWDALRITNTTTALSDFQQVPGGYSVCDFCLTLFGVLDYLFSENGQGCLEICRDDLEELGLISWDAEAGTVLIHRLTLHSVRCLLVKNALYLRPLIDKVVRKSDGGPAVEVFCESVSQMLTGELLSQVFFRTEELLVRRFNQHNPNKELKDIQTFELLAFLENLLETDQHQKILEDSLRPQVVTRMLLETHRLVRIMKDRFHIALADAYYPSLLEDCKGAAADCLPRSYVIIFYLTQGVFLENMGMLEEALSFYQCALSFCQCASVYQKKCHRSGYHFVAYAHLHIARVLCKLKGQRASDKYLMKAAETCNLLKFEQMRQRILTLLIQVGGDFQERNGLDNFICSEALVICKLLVYKLGEYGLWSQVKYEVDKTTLDCAMLFSKVCGEAQTILLRQIEQSKAGNRYEKKRQIHTMKMLFLFSHWQFSVYVDKSWAQAISLLKLRARIYSFVENSLPLISDCLSKENDRHGVWGMLVCFTDEYCRFACSAGLTQLAVRISHRLVKLWGETLSACGLISVNSGFQGNIEPSLSVGGSENWQWDGVDFCSLKGSGEQLQNKICALLFDGIWHLYEKKDFHAALSKFLAVLRIDTFLDCKVPELNECPCWLQDKGILLRFVLRLCTCLEHDVVIEVISILRVFGNNKTTPPTLQRAIALTINKLSLLPKKFPSRSLHLVFLEARNAFDKGCLTTACRASLDYWKNLVLLEPETEPHKGVLLDVFNVPNIFDLMLMQIAEYLWRIYRQKKRHVAAEWFLLFCIKFSKEKQRFWDSAKYRVQYGEFLREQARKSEVLQQFNLAEKGLVEQFGDDYSL